MIKTLALFGKGISQITTRSAVSKNSSMTLSFALKTLDELYEIFQLEIQLVISHKPVVILALDNNNEVIPNQIQTGNTLAIVHCATASSCMCHEIPMIPVGTTF